MENQDNTPGTAAASVTETAKPAPVILGSLASIERKGSIQAKFDFRGFTLDLRYVPRTTLQQLARENTVRRYEPSVKGPVHDVDAKKLAAAFSKKVVIGWEGLTLRKAANLVPLNVEGKTAEELDGTEVQFSQENLEYLVQNCYDLDVFLQNTVMDLSSFNAGLGEETKN